MLDLELTSYDRVVILTGAGISVASGIRPYRGPGGLWTENPELMALATAEAAQRDPTAPWRLFTPSRPEFAAAAPNRGHLALARFEARYPHKQVTLVTQNIDGLHQRAGSRNLIELHGNVSRSRCSDPECELEPFADDRSGLPVPTCELCGAPLRPDVVLFDEPIPARESWLAREALNHCDLFVAVGTSGTVSPAANFVRSAEYAGAHTVFVNLEPLDPPNPMFHEVRLGRAEELLPRLLGV